MSHGAANAKLFKKRCQSDHDVRRECPSLINESLSIANQSKNLETRHSRLRVIREKLESLKKMTIQYPFLHIVGLENFELSVRSVEAETMSLRASRVANGKNN